MFKKMDADMTARFWECRAKYAKLAQDAMSYVEAKMRQENRNALKATSYHVIHQPVPHTRQQIMEAVAKIEREWSAKMWKVIEDSFDGYEY